MQVMRIKRYHLASAPDTTTLDTEVSKLLAEGWQPFGQLVVTEPTEEAQHRFFQPVVQYEGEIRS
jgi:hypothetical protein